MLKPQSKIKNGGQILLIPHEEIVSNPSQPRRRFDCDELESLAESIRRNGILQPVNVRRVEEGYELIAGERRLRAARMVGLSRIPCILIEASDEKSALYALLENLQRADLNFFEEAEAIDKLITCYDISRDEAAQRLGMAPSTLANKLRLLRLPEDIRMELTRAGLSERHARALLRFENDTLLRRALKIVLERRLTVAETDRLIAQMLSGGVKKKIPPLKLFKDVKLFVNTINHAVDTMRRAGIEADSVTSETEEYIEYVVRIPKTGDYTVKAAGKRNSA